MFRAEGIGLFGWMVERPADPRVLLSRALLLEPGGRYQRLLNYRISDSQCLHAFRAVRSEHPRGRLYHDRWCRTDYYPQLFREPELRLLC